MIFKCCFAQVLFHGLSFEFLPRGLDLIGYRKAFCAAKRNYEFPGWETMGEGRIAITTAP